MGGVLPCAVHCGDKLQLARGSLSKPPSLKPNPHPPPAVRRTGADRGTAAGKRTVQLAGGGGKREGFEGGTLPGAPPVGWGSRPSEVSFSAPAGARVRSILDPAPQGQDGGHLRGR
ncbi:hypothetical protein AAFF_G00060550 [Aldrovandia affinis]|uniref:Uncharacterized protein n=1 Tax=Aldrovandia affinis TaxID=143900 RepID=A0AAD7WE16_9TELE|nr:hypothetical protein AAFF_G00060550 [Aldrovandia affinis]